MEEHFDHAVSNSTIRFCRWTTMIILAFFGFGSTNLIWAQQNTIYRDTLTIDSIKNKKIVISIEDTTMRFRACPDCITQYIADPNDRFHVIAILAIDSKGIVREYQCPMNKGVTIIHYDESGEITFMEYVNRKGKRKFIRNK